MADANATCRPVRSAGCEPVRILTSWDFWIGVVAGIVVMVLAKVLGVF
jgi:hypothetical protein